MFFARALRLEALRSGVQDPSRHSRGSASSSPDTPPRAIENKDSIVTNRARWICGHERMSAERPPTTRCILRLRRDGGHNRRDSTRAADAGVPQRNRRRAPATRVMASTLLCPRSVFRSLLVDWLACVAAQSPAPPPRSPRHPHLHQHRNDGGSAATVVDASAQPGEMIPRGSKRCGDTQRLCAFKDDADSSDHNHGDDAFGR